MLQSVIDIAERAGAAILTFYGRPVETTLKEDHSPVTQADLVANAVILEGLQCLDSSIPILSEESKMIPFEERKKWKRFWLVDPLDGTKEFIQNLGDFTVNIALIDQGEPVMGVIHAPAKSVLYYAERGKGAWRKTGGASERIYSGLPDQEAPLVVVGSRRHGVDELKEFLKSFPVKNLVSTGSSLKFCLVAEGTADVYPRLSPTMEWDVAAGDCIYRNSARSGQWESPLQYNKPDLRNGNFVIGMTAAYLRRKLGRAP